ncbi:helix-turn-helix transcriptional regulator [Trinickia dinghuensis]|uniref:XRE family transcriptional regulator n=1 Tax=Trinickia dinghuensis TaxID=2291023 RepID=A0A3D8K144_9BURK|nr:helix-turn-helix transcriptional regulator [Trinickia dinghuensis]RDU98614.1 XRE family transcriptional regulator [Trinickia dinghuensis]
MDYPIKTLSQLRPILKGFRKAAGMTQATVANHLGVTQQTYAQLEANPATVSIERLLKVLRVLGVSLVLTPAGVETHQDVMAPSPASAETQQRPTRNIRAKKQASMVEPTSALTGTPASAGKKKRAPANTGADNATTGKRHLPPQAVIKKRENW